MRTHEKSEANCVEMAFGDLKRGEVFFSEHCEFPCMKTVEYQFEGTTYHAMRIDGLPSPATPTTTVTWLRHASLLLNTGVGI